MELSTVTRAFSVLAVELDSGTLFLAATPGLLGRDPLLPIVAEWGRIEADGTEIVIERAGLPAEAAAAWWTNRQAAVLEVAPDAGSVYDGAIRFDGVISAEPDDEGGLLRLRLIPPRRRVVALPDLGLITADLYPLAAAAAMGKPRPMVFGTVEDCPLLPVRLPAATRLAADANAGDGQLDVEDAAALADAGTVRVDGHVYTYDAKSAQGNTLLGVAVLGTHRQGTACVASGDTVFLAAGHACAAITDVRAEVPNGTAPLAGGTVDLAGGTATFATPPLRVERSERFSVIAQFDQLGSGTTALNAINAIRAVTATVNQTASSLPAAVTAASANAAIGFARPAGRIVKGIYTVAFTVSIGAQIGWARLRVGNEVVWMMEPPASVLYTWSPATILFDDDSDLLPVLVEVAEGGTLDQVSVTITSASRVVSLGNLDDANFATLKGPSNLLWRADQTDVMAARGPIAKARLWVRWFANGTAALPTATVKFAGNTLGKLEQTQLAAATLSQTISVNVTAQGAAALPQQNIGALITGGTASLSHTAIAMRQQVTVPLTLVISGGWARAYAGCGDFAGWDASLGDIQVQIVYEAPDSTTASSKAALELVEFLTGSGWAQASGSSWSTLVAGQAYLLTVYLTQAPTSVRFTYAPADFSATVNYRWTSLSSVTLSYNSRITSSAVSQSNTPAGANPITAQSLTNNGITVGASNGAINFTVPAPPRVIDSLFDLSWVRDWSALVGQAEIAYSSGGPDLCINQVALIVDYDAQTLSRAESLTATVAGLSGNPADVIQRLAGKTGQACDAQALGRLRAWCDANAYAYGRRIAETTESLPELSTALSQVNALGAQSEGALAPVRRLDFGRESVTIRESDLLAPARITWAEPIENAITLRYREDYTTRSARLPGGANGDFARALVADAANNAWCRQSQAAIREVRAIQIEAGWLRDDASAARYLADVTRLNARPRRVLELPCTFATTAREGALIDYLPSGAAPGDGVSARITAVSLDGPWPTLTAEQILD